LPKRLAAALLRPGLEVTTNGQHWKFVSKALLVTHTTEFDLNLEFAETTADGRQMRSIVQYTNGRLTLHQRKIRNSDKDSTLVAQIEGGRLVIRLNSEGVTAEVVYKRA